MKYEEIIIVRRNLKLKINTNLNTQIYISLKRVQHSIRETDLIINHIFFRVILLAVMFFLNGFKLPSAGKRELNLSESLEFRLFPRAGPAPHHSLTALAAPPRARARRATGHIPTDVSGEVPLSGGSSGGAACSSERGGNPLWQGNFCDPLF